MDYPRYKPSRMRPPGKGAFFDYAVTVLNRDAPKLKSSRVNRQWRKGTTVMEMQKEKDVA